MEAEFPKLHRQRQSINMGPSNDGRKTKHSRMNREARRQQTIIKVKQTLLRNKVVETSFYCLNSIFNPEFFQKVRKKLRTANGLEFFSIIPVPKRLKQCMNRLRTSSLCSAQSSNIFITNRQPQPRAQSASA